MARSRSLLAHAEPITARPLAVKIRQSEAIGPVLQMNARFGGDTKFAAADLSRLGEPDSPVKTTFGTNKVNPGFFGAHGEKLRACPRPTHPQVSDALFRSQGGTLPPVPPPGLKTNTRIPILMPHLRPESSRA